MRKWTSVVLTVVIVAASHVAAPIYRTLVPEPAAAQHATGAHTLAFYPEEPVTRCQLATILWRMAGSPAVAPEVGVWPDVSSDSFCYTASRWAHREGWIRGIPVDPIEAAIAIHFSDQSDKARRVGTCESGLDNSAVGSAGEVSWLQIHPGWWEGWGSGTPLVAQLGYTKEDLVRDPIIAAEVARAILDRNGGQWYPTWTCGNA